MNDETHYDAAEKFINWLAKKVEADATGRELQEMESRPEGKFWLGRLAPESEILNHDLGTRAERLEPCAVGIRVLPKNTTKKFFISGRASFSVWSHSDRQWTKSKRIIGEFSITVDVTSPNKTRITEVFRDALAEADISQSIAAAIDVEVTRRRECDHDLTVTLVNISDPDHDEAKENSRGRLFECQLELFETDSENFVLESLPDSFRYDRRVPAWGVNCGVKSTEGGFCTLDLPTAEKKRPTFWNVEEEAPDFRFETLAKDPFPSLSKLVEAHQKWGKREWNIERISELFDQDSEKKIHNELATEKNEFETECTRLREGIEYLRSDENLLRSFKMMNEAMILSARGKYDSWRPFQIGFLLANISSCRGDEKDVVDIVWFATGGGKTETYLGLILTAAFYDRFRGKITGITAWSRFPLRLLSLQQTQRFANALAAAELVKRKYDIPGDSFGLGFLIGDGSTPNKIDDAKNKGNKRWDPNDLSMADRLQMLKVCPYCREDSIEMRFKRLYWRVEHNCTNQDCDWGNELPLPIYVVDTEIWRVLPTVIVGTLDKAAGVALQANMKGMIGAPAGLCPESNHGHTYAARWGRANGCLVPDCEANPSPVPMSNELYGMTYRLQDELHLLRDSLGAVDAHYEALLDHLQNQLCDNSPKVLASSATLSGYKRQSSVLYQREARVFPHPEPRIGKGFWAGDTESTMRKFLAVAPRGQTIEYAIDRMVVSLQSAIRELLVRPREIATELEVDESEIQFLIDTYGTNVIYGNTLRDLDAIERSANTQWGDIPEPRPNVTSLTGRTQFGDVSNTLDRLEEPEANFEDRLHVVAASSMMSHGVDVDRLNTMVMLGLPLTTSEFIQATARVGRRWPALTFVVHKIGRERDASIYRTFPTYVTQGDRFVEPIPITGRSRRVLERTIPGLAFARILMLHEHLADKTIWKAYGLKEYIAKTPNFALEEASAICEFLGYNNEASEVLKQEVINWYERWISRINDPTNSESWVNELGIPPIGPMRSLRDVAEPIDVWGRDPS